MSWTDTILWSLVVLMIMIGVIGMANAVQPPWVQEQQCIESGGAWTKTFECVCPYGTTEYCFECWVKTPEQACMEARGVWTPPEMPIPGPCGAGYKCLKNGQEVSASGIISASLNEHESTWDFTPIIIIFSIIIISFVVLFFKIL